MFSIYVYFNLPPPQRLVYRTVCWKFYSDTCGYAQIHLKFAKKIKQIRREADLGLFFNYKCIKVGILWLIHVIYTYLSISILNENLFWAHLRYN